MAKRTVTPRQHPGGGGGGTPFIRGGGDGPLPLVTADGGSEGGHPLGAFHPLPVSDPTWTATPQPSPGTSGRASVEIYGVVRMFYMQLFGYAATSISVNGGSVWLDYSHNPQVIALLEASAGKIINNYALVTGSLRLQNLGFGLVPVIAVDTLAPDL